MKNALSLPIKTSLGEPEVLKSTGMNLRHFMILYLSSDDLAHHAYKLYKPIVTIVTQYIQHIFHKIFNIVTLEFIEFFL